MATIMTGIQLADNFTAPLMSMINATNLAIAVFDDMNRSMNAGVDVASLEAARSELAQASVAAQQLNENIQQMNDPIGQNTAGQEQFNASVRAGIGESSNLLDSIKRMAATYATLQTGKNILGASDDLVQTTSRLNMMNPINTWLFLQLRSIPKRMRKEIIPNRHLEPYRTRSLRKINPDPPKWRA